MHDHLPLMTTYETNAKVCCLESTHVSHHGVHLLHTASLCTKHHVCLHQMKIREYTKTLTNYIAMTNALACSCGTARYLPRMLLKRGIRETSQNGIVFMVDWQIKRLSLHVPSVIQAQLSLPVCQCMLDSSNSLDTGMLS